MSDKPEIGKICYEAYCNALDNEGFNQFPVWEDLEVHNQLAWQLAAKAVVTYEA